MLSAAERARFLAIEAAASRLKDAATYAEAHAGKPLFQRIMRRRGGRAALVRLDWPGVLRVFDYATGELLAESAPGSPRQLAPDVDPSSAGKTGP